MAKCFALLGWSLPVIESMQKTDENFVVVSFPDFEHYANEHDIPFVPYQLDEWGDQSNSLDLHQKLEQYNADVAVPLFEETVEWAEALNSIYQKPGNKQKKVSGGYLPGRLMSWMYAL